jgi:hypothetical protein
MMQSTLRFLLFTLGALLIAGAAHSVPLKVDISPGNGRKDVLTPDVQQWLVKDAESVFATFGDVKVTFRKAGDVGNGLAAVLWKGGLDYGVHLAIDGVTVKDGDKGGQIEMMLGGLSPGKHNVVTYHSGVSDADMSPFDVIVDGVVKLHGVCPSKRVTDEYDATTASFEVEAVAGKDVVIRFKPDGSGKIDNVIINGFEIDGVDPARRAIKPTPAHKYEHVAPDPVLTWTPAKSATSHQVYFGVDADAVANATPAAPEFKGARKDAKFATSGLNTFDTYYWRVDEFFAGDPSVSVKGEVWKFRVRHLAFPGAEGYGRFARGGRGGRVIEVTNLNDAGPGSLREACEAFGPRTVVFRVGGIIELKSKIIVRNPYVTVAGQTAPGDGICIKNYSFGCLGTHDVIVRHLRVRIGDETGETLDGMGLASCDQCIVDHCSISWTIDESFSSRGAKNITFQRNLIAEALNHAGHKKYVGTGRGHGFAASIGGGVGSFHHNLLAHNAGRNWSLAGGLDQSARLAGRLDIRNNVVFNWEHRTTDGGCRELNFVNNFYIPGPATRVFTLQKPDPGDPARGMRIYLVGNQIEGREKVNADNWSAAVMDPQWLPRVRSDAPLFEPYVTTQSVEDAYASVIEDAGATLPKRDAVDTRVVEDVKKRAARFSGATSKVPGIIDSQREASGWPVYKSAEPPADGDHDGMPDAWEKAHGLNPADASDGAKDAGDGFTHLENYLNVIGAKPAPDAAAAAANANEVGFTNRENELEVTIGGRVVATYVYRDADTARPFFKNVKTRSGIQVTRNRPVVAGKDPADHADMHPGLWLAFSDLNGKDFWRNNGARVEHERFAQPPSGGDVSGTFSVVNRYASPSGASVCRESATYSIVVRPNGYWIVWDSMLAPTGERLEFGSAEEMGLGVRVATPITVKTGGGRITNSGGGVNEKGTWGQAADWCDYAGMIGEKKVGVALFTRPADGQKIWFHSRDYGLMVANAFGPRAVAPECLIVRGGKALHLRFGAFVHESRQDIDLAAEWAAFRQDGVARNSRPEQILQK